MNLEQFLEQERQGGQQVDEGQFSIALEVALEKLSRYQLAQPELYLLRLLQCAVTTGGREIAAWPQPHHHKVSFWVDEPGSFGEVAGLLSRLEKPSKTNSPMDHLTAALQACLGQGALQASWSQVRGRRLERLILTSRGVELTRTYDQKGAAARSLFSFEATFPSTLGSRLRNWLRGTRGRLEGHLLIQERCQGLPSDLKLGRYRLQRLGEIAVPQCCRLAPSRSLEPGFRVVAHHPHKMTILDRAGDGASAEKDAPLRCSHYAFRNPELFSQSTLVKMVRDGVVLDTIEANASLPGVEVWTGAATLRTDLSGLRLVRDDSHQQQVSEALEFAQRYLPRY